MNEQTTNEGGQKVNATETPSYSGSWVGQDGRTYREVRYWVGAGWTAGFLQYQDDLGNWHGYY